MFSALLPARQIEYQTDLTPDQINQRLTESVITSFTIYSKKPYYGGYSPYGFSVRKTSSNFKRESISPSVEGSYRTGNGNVLVTLRLRPHTIWVIALFLFGFPFGLFLLFSISAFFRTGDIEALFSGLFTIAFFYGIFRVIFKIQSDSDIRFWEQRLELQPLRP